MDRIRGLFDRLTNSTRDSDLGDGTGDGSARRVYRCGYCGCTTETSGECCPECQSDWFVSGERASASDGGFTCSECAAVVDYRYERCPECGSTGVGGRR